MPDYLKDWPRESDPEKEGLILQCHKANIAIDMAIDYGLGGHRDLILLQKSLAIVRERLKEAVAFFEKILKLYDKNKEAYPRWTLLALGIVTNNGPPSDVGGLLAANERLLEESWGTNSEAIKLKTMRRMSDNFEEIQNHLRGERWPGPSRPRRKP